MDSIQNNLPSTQDGDMPRKFTMVCGQLLQHCANTRRVLQKEETQNDTSPLVNSVMDNMFFDLALDMVYILGNGTLAPTKDPNEDHQNAKQLSDVQVCVFCAIL